MLNKIHILIMMGLRTIAALWLCFMGGIASLMLYNEIFDPEWGRQAKERFPHAPEWYILAVVAVAAMACFYFAYWLVWPRKKHKDKKVPVYREEG